MMAQKVNAWLDHKKSCLLKICERISNSLNVWVCICLQIEAIKAEHTFHLSWITRCSYLWRLRLNLVTCDFKVYPRMLSYSFFFLKCPKCFTISMLQFKIHLIGRIGGENKKKKKKSYNQRRSDGSEIFCCNSLLLRGIFPSCLLPCLVHSLYRLSLLWNEIYLSSDPC